MRITNNMIYNRLLSDLNNNLSAYRKSQEIISSERSIHRPSDDPMGIGISTIYRNQHSYFSQYLKNLDVAEKNLRASDSAFQNLSNILIRAREIAEQHATGTVNEAQSQIAVSQLDQLINSAIEIANTKVGDNYIFSGFKTDSQTYSLTGRVLPVYAKNNNVYDGSAFITGEFTGNTNHEKEIRVVTAGAFGTAEYQVSEDGGQTWSENRTLLNTINIGDGLTMNFSGSTPPYFETGDSFKVYIVEGKLQGDSGQIDMNVNRNTTITSNLTAKEVLEGSNFFDSLYRLRIGLENSDKFVIGKSLEELRETQSKFSVSMVETGVRLNRIEITRNNLEVLQENFNGYIQEIEKPDLINALTKLAMEEHALNNSVNILSKVFPHSLINYI